MPVRGPYETQTHDGAPSTLGERLRFLRIRSGRTQLELAEALHTDQAQVSTWERDRAKPSRPVLAALATHFGVTPGCLESGEGFMESLVEPSASGTEDAETPFGLPRLGSAPVVALESPGLTPRSVEPMEAMRLLMDAAQAGRPVWLVLGR